jgi:tetratricopeptide (TPR) repeat protein
MPSNRSVLFFLLAAPVFGGLFVAQVMMPVFGQVYGPDPDPEPALAPAAPAPAPGGVYGPEPAGELMPVYQYQQSSVGAGHLAPNVVTTPESMRAVLEQALGLVRSQRCQQALPLIEQFVTADPQDAEGYFWQGVALAGLHQWQRALDSYSQAFRLVQEIGMDSAELQTNVGNVLLEQDKPAMACVHYSRAAEIDPEMALVQLNWGRALLQQKDAAEALAHFRRCEELQFQPQQLHYYRAKALLQVGRREEARKEIHILLSEMPAENEVAQKIKQEFAELLKTQRDGAFSVR